MAKKKSKKTEMPEKPGKGTKTSAAPAEIASSERLSLANNSLIHIAGVGPKNIIAFICFFMSGFAGLIYEICWIRKASLIFGSTTYAVSAILAVFFLGLAVGSYVLGSIAQRTKHPLRLFALLELSVGILALASPFAFDITDTIYGMAYRAANDQFALLMLVRIGLVSLILLPPTILMGGTLPLFCRQYVNSESGIARSVGFLYGLNTVGAAVGCAVTGLWLLPNIGMFGAICIGALLNFTVALTIGFFGLHKSLSARASEPESHTAETGNYPAVFTLVFLIGFVALGNEVLWARHLALLIHNTVYTYTLTLTAVLIGIVLGSIATAAWFDHSKSQPFWFGMLQVAIGLATLGLMLIPAYLWARFDPLPLSTYFILLLPTAVLSGAAFPLCVRMLVTNPALAGIGVGRLYAVNTLGGIAGSIVVGFFSLPALGQQSTLLFTTGLSLTCGFIAWFVLDRSSSSRIRWIAVVASLVIWVALPKVTGTRLPADFLCTAKKGQLIAYREGLSANLGIIQRYPGDRMLEINRLWQGTNGKTGQILTAHVPMLLHPNPRSVLMVGAGTGQTASRFLMYNIDRLDCVDIEPAVFDVIRDYFDSRWMNDKRVRLMREDGRNYVAHTGGRYDVISIEVGQIERPGVPSFYTSEFYELAKKRLEPGGFITQLVSLPFYTVEQFRSVVATFLKTFPQSFLWYDRDDMLLIGVNSPQIQLSGYRLGVLQNYNAVSYDLHMSLIPNRPQYGMYQRFVFLGSFVAGPNGLSHLSAGAPIYHDDKPVLDYAVAKWNEKQMNEFPIVALLHENLDSVTQILNLPLDRDEMAQIEQVREANLFDLDVAAWADSHSYKEISR